MKRFKRKKAERINADYASSVCTEKRLHTGIFYEKLRIGLSGIGGFSVSFIRLPNTAAQSRADTAGASILH